jgi:hypothetical protein
VNDVAIEVKKQPQAGGGSSADVPGSRGIRFMKPDKFSGTTSVETFLIQFDVCADYNNWNETDRVAQLNVALQGPRHRYYGTDRQTPVCPIMNW